MTRKEEIQEASKVFSVKCLGDLYNANQGRICELSYQAGAEWADKTVIEKVCKWLSNGYKPYDKVVEDFRKAMEE